MRPVNVERQVGDSDTDGVVTEVKGKQSTSQTTFRTDSVDNFI